MSPEKERRRLSPLGWCIAIFLSLLLASFIIPLFGRMTDSARQTRQINNAKAITLAIHIWASDRSGTFPFGTYDPNTPTYDPRSSSWPPPKDYVFPLPADDAESCFNDLFKAGAIEIEKVFWNPHHRLHCFPSPPDENGNLKPGENCWDYIRGLNNSSRESLPLIFEASDDGKGSQWTDAGGHPWKDFVIVGYVDGSAEKLRLNADRQLKTMRDRIGVDLCVPVPDKQGWRMSAKLCPATKRPNLKNLSRPTLRPHPHHPNIAPNSFPPSVFAR